MTDCRQIESLLPPYVDDEAGPDATAQIEAHLSTCGHCRRRVAAQRSARAVLRARAGALVTAPPGLRTRIHAALRPEAASSLGWRGRLTALGAPAVVVLALVTGFEFLSPSSNVVLAAQLAVDHVRCFIVEFGSIDATNATGVKREYLDRYGWNIDVPASTEGADLTLVAARRCPFWLGNHAHLLYRRGDRHVSLYVTQGLERPTEHLALLGHVERIWAAKGNTYTLVTRGIPAADLSQIAEYFESATNRTAEP